MDPADPCRVCNPSRASSELSPNVGATCGAQATECSAEDSCDSQGRCAENDLLAGTPCGPGSIGRCTQGGECSTPQVCGDGFATGNERCDDGALGSRELGACNPECTGTYERRTIRMTARTYRTNLGGPRGADALCEVEFGPGWRALLVGGGRRATVTPFVGDGQLDWVLEKYRYYFNANNQLIWRTDSVALLGARNGQAAPLLAPLFDTSSGFYPWAGYGRNWATLPESIASGTCFGWASERSTTHATFVVETLGGASEPCGRASTLLCVEP